MTLRKINTLFPASQEAHGSINPLQIRLRSVWDSHSIINLSKIIKVSQYYATGTKITWGN